MIRPIHDNDIAAVTDIYNFYVINSVATFETEPVTVDDMSQRVTKVHSQDFPWLVAENEEGRIVGYAYASTWKERYAYRFTAEITVYLASNTLQKGIGTQLYSTLFSSLQQCSITNVIGCITLPNKASEVLHEKFGMEKVGHFKKVGYKFDKWLDVGFWQGSLELNK
jgi:phosphinothricin acetyltransferase